VFQRQLLTPVNAGVVKVKSLCCEHPGLDNAQCRARIIPWLIIQIRKGLCNLLWPSLASTRSTKSLNTTTSQALTTTLSGASIYIMATGSEAMNRKKLRRSSSSSISRSSQTIKTGSRILDIGCGFGGSSLYLAKKYGASATGITISPVQVQMAREAAAKANLDASFLLMDAEDMQFAQPFDLLWSVESISHYHNPRNSSCRR